MAGGICATNSWSLELIDALSPRVVSLALVNSSLRIDLRMLSPSLRPCAVSLQVSCPYTSSLCPYTSPYTIPTRLPTRLLVHVRVSPDLYGTIPLPEFECILSLYEAYSETTFPETNMLQTH